MEDINQCLLIARDSYDFLVRNKSKHLVKYILDPKKEFRVTNDILKYIKNNNLFILEKCETAKFTKTRCGLIILSPK